jgi:hypothetical protein
MSEPGDCAVADLGGKSKELLKKAKSKACELLKKKPGPSASTSSSSRRHTAEGTQHQNLKKSSSYRPSSALHAISKWIPTDESKKGARVRTPRAKAKEMSGSKKCTSNKGNRGGKRSPAARVEEKERRKANKKKKTEADEKAVDEDGASLCLPLAIILTRSFVHLV